VSLEHDLFDATEIRRRFPTLAPDGDTVAFYETVAGLVRTEPTLEAYLRLAVAARRRRHRPHVGGLLRGRAARPVPLGCSHPRWRGSRFGRSGSCTPGSSRRAASRTSSPTGTPCGSGNGVRTPPAWTVTPTASPPSTARPAA
jgi:hypothetical protein